MWTIWDLPWWLTSPVDGTALLVIAWTNTYIKYRFALECPMYDCFTYSICCVCLILFDEFKGSIVSANSWECMISLPMCNVCSHFNVQRESYSHFASLQPSEFVFSQCIHLHIYGTIHHLMILMLFSLMLLSSFVAFDYTC